MTVPGMVLTKRRILTMGERSDTKRSNRRSLVRCGLLGLAGALIAIGVIFSVSNASVAKTTAKPDDKSAAAYQSCLKSHGVKGFSGLTGKAPSGTPPKGSGAGGKRPAIAKSSKFAKAQAASKSKLPAGGVSGPGGALIPP